jgi:hypothetical protein
MDHFITPYQPLLPLNNLFHITFLSGRTGRSRASDYATFLPFYPDRISTPASSQASWDGGRHQAAGAGHCVLADAHPD